MSAVTKYLIGKGKSVQIDALPLMHTANGEDFLSILGSRAIVPHQCTVFAGENLSYFFIGRPAYKTAIVNDASYWQLPAVFVLNQISDPPVKRAFPFDSGAMTNQRYRDIIGKIERDEFELGDSQGSVSAVIEFYFANSKRYLAAEARPYQDIRDEVGDETSAFPILALSKLYSYPFNELLDDRVRLIELQYSDPIPLNDVNLRGVIVCKEWLRDQAICDQLNDIGCTVEHYPIHPLNSANYYSKIYELAERFFP